MAGYVDGFLLPLPKKNVAAYKKLARLACKVWLEHGALEYRECIGEDLSVKGMRSFTNSVDCKRGETVVFAWIRYRSKAHRDRVNAKVMKDERMAKMMEKGAMPFDVTRMFYGGFEVAVEGTSD